MENNLSESSNDHLHQCGGALNGCKKCWSTHYILKIAVALAIVAIVFATGYTCGKMSGRYHNRNRGFGTGQNMIYFNKHMPMQQGGMMIQGAATQNVNYAPGTQMMRFSVPTNQSDTPNAGTFIETIPSPQQ
jgi:hypothetical protein